MKSVYNEGDHVFYEGTLQEITGTDIGSSSGELYLDPERNWVDTKDVEPAGTYSKYTHLVKGGIVFKSKGNLYFFPFRKSVPESAPKEVIDHWITWLNEGEEEHAI